MCCYKFFFFYICPASDILKTNLTKFVAIWGEKASIGMFLWIRSKITLTKEKEMRKRKINGCTSSFIMATLEIVLGRKKLLGTKSPIDGTVKTACKNLHFSKFGKTGSYIWG